MIAQYIKGMLEISVEGVNLERFMNKCSAKGIPLYSVYRKKYDYMQCAIKLSDFKAIASVNRELRCRIRVRKRYGLKFLFNRVRRRKAFVIGAAVFTIFMIIMCSSIWRIDIKGIDRLNATQILNVINEQHQGVGIFKAKCDTKALELAIKKALPAVDWVIVDINGVVMTVDVIETVERPEKIDTSPSRIISEVAGEIVSINAIRGDAKVAPGSMVNVGDILVDGVCERTPEEPFTMIVNSLGQITAKVTYTGTAAVKLSDIDSRHFTGNVERHLEYTVLGKTIGEKACSFQNYETEVTEYPFFSEGRLFPIVAKSVIYKEYVSLSDKEIQEQAQNKLFISAYNDAMRLIPINASIESRNIEYSFDAASRTFSAKATVTAIHRIGATKKLTEEEINAITGEHTKNE